MVPAFNEGEAAWSVDLEEGEDGGDGTFGFQDANPGGLDRGAGGFWAVDTGAVAEFSNAAILARKEPGLGIEGGG